MVESLCDPYFQYFTGAEFFQHVFPHVRSDLSHWRKRLGGKLELLLVESLRVASVKLLSATPQDGVIGGIPDKCPVLRKESKPFSLGHTGLGSRGSVMSVISKPAALRLIAAGLFVCCSDGALRAQEYGTVPGAIPDPSTYQGSMELQRREQEQQQQYEQQQQSQPSTQGQPGYGGAPYSGPVASPAAPWRKLPPLPAAKNPLLGRWHPNGADASQVVGSTDNLGALFGPDFAAMTKNLAGGILGGGCDSMFGRGVIEFRPDTL
jgi:hypothetical protein